MAEFPDMPGWLNKLVAGRPGAADVFLKWEIYEAQFSKRGVTPDMLEPIGPEDRPIGIGVRRPGEAWTHTKIEYHTDQPQVLDTLDALLHKLDGLG